MIPRNLIISAVFIFLIPQNVSASSVLISNSMTLSTFQDTIADNQWLYNGRIWRNLFASVEGDQFLFSKEYLPGEVSMRGKEFKGILLMYDIFRDEIITPYKPVGLLQINKEMVDSFSLYYDARKYEFERIRNSGNEETDGYFNVLYKGRSKLYVRYQKKIEKLADGGLYDKFYMIVRIYVETDGKIILVSSKKDIINLFPENSKQLKDFIRKSRISFDRNNPDSYIPIIKYADTLESHP